MSRVSELPQLGLSWAVRTPEIPNPSIISVGSGGGGWNDGCRYYANSLWCGVVGSITSGTNVIGNLYTLLQLPVQLAPEYVQGFHCYASTGVGPTIGIHDVYVGGKGGSVPGAVVLRVGGFYVNELIFNLGWPINLPREV